MVVLTMTILGVSARSEDPRLGKIRFPTSARSEEAQSHFLRGVAALHSFWYPVALSEFQAATRIEPDFMMGYWGEAMAHNHPIWGDPQETEAARKVLAKITITPELTPREQAYLHAVKILYGAQIGVAPPTFLLSLNHPVDLHFSYQRYLENQLRKQFDFTGTPILFKVRTRKH